ncbi:class I SAM-dependent methyltransferase [Luteimonas sp. Y-2-2-4F]|nr:class I SAM-dependent methyltransferase [Luteimonas sp. Y-2-2-4F]MCD9030555.1 class I SAM-dependent methyltransferase [Luteimonas sp. Y-2-2-4F]
MNDGAGRFADHFSGVAEGYAEARPEYPDALFDWIAAVAPATAQAWEPGCGSGQASRSLAARFDAVLATDPSAAQIARARGPANVRFAVEPGERCSLGDGAADVVCVAQALHWFDRPAFFRECARVLRPRGVLVAWGYQDMLMPGDVAEAARPLLEAIRGDWPAGRALVDSGYAGFDWPFEALAAPPFDLAAEWPLARLLAYLGTFSAVQRHRARTGADPVAAHAPAIAAAWGDAATRPVRWPLFVHARRRRPE